MSQLCILLDIRWNTEICHNFKSLQLVETMISVFKCYAFLKQNTKGTNKIIMKCNKTTKVPQKLSCNTKHWILQTLLLSILKLQLRGQNTTIWTERQSYCYIFFLRKKMNWMSVILYQPEPIQYETRSSFITKMTSHWSARKWRYI